MRTPLTRTGRRGRHAAALLTLLFGIAGCSSGSGGVGEVVREPARAEGAALPSSAEAARRLLSLHNRERQAVNAPPLQWDAGLAAAAASYAAELARSGQRRLVHSKPAARPGQGENLWVGSHELYFVEEMFGGWAAEKAQFRPGTFPHVFARGKWEDVAHYTQIIWRGTRRVGCAIRQTQKWDYLVCRYTPAGNVVGQRVP